MRRRGTTIRRASAAIAACALALTACQSGQGSTQTGPPPEIGGGDIDATPPASDEPTEPTAAGEDWTPPDPLTEEYLLRVLTSLEADRAEFTRWLIDSEANEQPPTEARAAMERYFPKAIAGPAIEASIEDHARNPAAPGAMRPYGQYRPVSIEVLRDDPNCVLLEVVWDESEVRAEGGNRRDVEIMNLIPAAPKLVENESGWLVNAVELRSDISDADIEEELQTRALCEGK